MATNYMKICSTSLVKREMQIRTNLCYHYYISPASVAKVKETDNPKY